MCWPGQGGGRWIAPGVRVEPRRRCRLDGVVDLDVRVAGGEVRMCCQLVERHGGAEAGVGSLQLCRPSGRGAAQPRSPRCAAEPLATGSCRAVASRRDRARAGRGAACRTSARGPDRDEPVVGRAVHAVPGRAALEPVRSPSGRPFSRRRELEDAAHQRGDAVDHGDVDDLAAYPSGCARRGPTMMPNASSIPPPPKSPTRFSGTCGISPARPIAARAPATAM